MSITVCEIITCMRGIYSIFVVLDWSYTIEQEACALFEHLSSNNFVFMSNMISKYTYLLLLNPVRKLA